MVKSMQNKVINLEHVAKTAKYIEYERWEHLPEEEAEKVKKDNRALMMRGIQGKKIAAGHLYDFEGDIKRRILEVLELGLMHLPENGYPNYIEIYDDHTANLVVRHTYSTQEVKENLQDALPDNRPLGFIAIRRRKN